MLKRILTAVVALCIFVPVLWFSDTIVFPIAIAILSGVACYEVFCCIGQIKNYALSIPVILVSTALPIVARYAATYVVTVFLALFCYITVCSVIGYKKADVAKIGFVFYEVFAVSVGFTLLVMSRDLAPVTYLLVFICAWMTDTFAYFTGYFFGRHKLCPEISPKKTVEGAVGGIVGAVFGAVVLGIIADSQDILKVALIAIPLSVLGQIGDLAASLTKRYFGIKDYGNIFPGHGGVLDRFDSILPITVTLYILLGVL